MRCVWLVNYGLEWKATSSIAANIGCTAEALGADKKARIKALEREVKELGRANEILRKASAYFAMAELDRREK